MRPKKPASRSILILRRPGRNSLSCTTPFLTFFCFGELRDRDRLVERVGDRLLAIDVLAGLDRLASAGRRASAWSRRRRTPSSFGFFSAASRSVVERSMPYCRASAATFSALRPTRIGSGITRSPFGSATPPCSRIATIERTRCWLSPMRPVTPYIMMPSLRIATSCLPLAIKPSPREA